MTGTIIVVKAAKDAEAGVWFVESSDLPGLNLEAETLEALVELLPGAVADLTKEGGWDGFDADSEIPIELIAHASTRVRLSVAA